jgi:predicted methyltransferase
MPFYRALLPRLLLSVAALLMSAAARADLYSDAVQHPGRPAADLQRDAIDHPVEVLRLSGIRPGMRVADLLAGDGYYSQLLSYIVGPRGHVYLLNNKAYDQWTENAWQERLVAGRLPNVEHQTIDVEHLGLPAHSLDALLLIKVYHDFYWHPDAGPWPNINVDAALNEIARVVKPGGILLLVDHSAKPGSGNTDTNRLHRIDEQYAAKDFARHGFRLIATSQVLRRPDDPRDMLTYKGEMVGKTDRFVMVFRRTGHR